MQGYGVYWVKLRLYAVGKSRFKSFVELNSNLLKWIPSPPRYEKVRVPILTFSSFHVSCCITSKKRMARPETRWLLPNKSPSSIISQSRAAIGTLHSSSLQSTISSPTAKTFFTSLALGRVQSSRRMGLLDLPRWNSRRVQKLQLQNYSGNREHK